jgi:cytochrome c oxidase subunit II
MQAPAKRRDWIARALGLAALPVLGISGRLALAQVAEPQLVKLRAQRFVYTPAEFRVKAGAPVVLEFTSLDFVHGFHLPDLKVRADLPPGVTTRVKLAALQPGIYEFLCDNFCGDEHEEMHGRMIVEA